MLVVWSDFAIENLKNIYLFYSETASKDVAHKIRKQILDTSKLLKSNPEIGQIEYWINDSQYQYRYILSGNYKIIYRIDENEIYIMDVFDVRQHPDKILNKNRD